MNSTPFYPPLCLPPHAPRGGLLPPHEAPVRHVRLCVVPRSFWVLVPRSPWGFFVINRITGFADAVVREKSLGRRATQLFGRHGCTTKLGRPVHKLFTIKVMMCCILEGFVDTASHGL